MTAAILGPGLVIMLPTQLCLLLSAPGDHLGMDMVQKELPGLGQIVTGRARSRFLFHCALQKPQLASGMTRSCQEGAPQLR